jgi:hypothetical protein
VGRRFSLPFKTAVGHEVTLGAWHVRMDAGADYLLMGDAIAGWDYRAHLQFHRFMTVDREKLNATCELPAGADVAAVVIARSPAARFRKAVWSSAVGAYGVSEHSVEFELDGALLSQEVVLDTELILSGAVTGSSPFVAKRPGSRLHQEQARVVIEGSASRLPVEISDLSVNVPGLNAPCARWFIQLEDADLHAPVMGKLRVLLNAAMTTTVELARAGDPLTLSLLAADTARRLLGAALRDDEFLGDPRGFNEGSIGDAASNLLALCFPGESAAAVQTLMTSDPGRFEATIQSCVKVGDG